QVTGWEERFADSLQAIAGIISRHRNYLREYKSADAWGCATPPQVCERLAAFAPADPEWMRGLAEAYDVIGNEQTGANQIASLRAALFFREQLIALEQQRASTLRQFIEQSAADKNEKRALTMLPGFANRPARPTRAAAGQGSNSSDGKEQDKARIE